MIEDEKRAAREEKEAAEKAEADAVRAEREARKEPSIFEHIGNAISGMVETEEDPFAVTVQCHVHSAFGLPATDSKWDSSVAGASDPYVVLSIVTGNPLSPEEQFQRGRSTYR